MALREYTNRDGRRWQVWRTVPTVGSRSPYRGPDRRAAGNPGHVPLLDRRGSLRLRRVLLAELQDGWLCFETEGEKRRLAPVPLDWDTCSDSKLALYLREAAVVPRRMGASDSIAPLAAPAS